LHLNKQSWPNSWLVLGFYSSNLSWTYSSYY
jgi:hypothetical protein